MGKLEKSMEELIKYGKMMSGKNLVVTVQGRDLFSNHQDTKTRSL